MPTFDEILALIGYVKAPALLPPKAAAARLGLPERTLALWREKRRGPKYFRLEGAVRYSAADLENWLAAQAVEAEPLENF